MREWKQKMEKAKGTNTRMALTFSGYRPSLPLPACISKGMKGGWYAKLSGSARPTSIPLLPPFLSPYPPACPSPFPCPALSMPSFALWIHPQIKQIYHSVTETGKGGRLWNALAVRAGKGSEHGAPLPRTFPAAPALALSGSVSLFCFHDLCDAPPAAPPYPFPVLPVPTQARVSADQAAQSCDNTAPGLTRTSTSSPPSLL